MDVDGGIGHAMRPQSGIDGIDAQFQRINSNGGTDPAITSSMQRNRSLVALLFAQTQVVFNDNAAKLMLVAMAPLILPPREADITVGLVAALLVLPFILFSPFCGWLADRFPKQRILRDALLLQFLGMFLLMAALWFHSLPGAVAVFFLLALQSCLFSPSKQGALKEIVGEERLGQAVGWMEMLTICAILGGSLGGGWLLDQGTKLGGDVWRGGFLAAAALTVLCLPALAAGRAIRTEPAHVKEPFTFSLFWNHVHDLRHVWSMVVVRRSALGVAYFYGLGGLLYLVIVQSGREAYAGSTAAAVETGILLAILGAGVAVGALTAVRRCRHGIDLGLIPVGGLMMPFVLLLLGLSEPASHLFKAGLFIFGVASGFFIVPLNATLQNEAPAGSRGRILAAGNLLSNLAGIAAVGCYLACSAWLGMESRAQMLLLAAVTFGVAIYLVVLLPESLMRLAVSLPGWMIYRLRLHGIENLPKGGALLVCNHVSYVDAVVLQIASPRPIRFLAYEAFFSMPLLGAALRLVKAIPISSHHAKDAIRLATDALGRGDLVCIFPEGALTRTGKLMGFRRGFELIARRAHVPVVPVHLDSLWGSVFSFSGNRYFTKLPRRIPYPVTISFGAPIPAEAAEAKGIRRAILDLGERAFRERDILKESLGWAMIKALCTRPWQVGLIDRTAGRAAYRRGTLLGLAMAVARTIKSWDEAHVGVALPPGAGATVFNLACVLAGKVPVNLNLTAGREAALATLERAGIKRIITAEAVRKQFKEFPWTAETPDAAVWLGGMKKAELIPCLAAGWLLPAGWLRRGLGVSREGGDREAVLLFTSGSSGQPKGVPLTHANLLGNISQIDAVNMLQQKDVVLGCLPLFHSLGMTMTLWLTLLRGVKVVTVPSPLDAKAIGVAAEEEKVTVILGTTTFLRRYLVKVKPEQFKTVRMAVAGAEKLPADVVEAYQKTFGTGVYEGYGMTECSPLVSVNLPNPTAGAATADPQEGGRIGSVGRLMPGITARLFDPETGAETDGSGILALKGVNIFRGYLGQPEKTAEMMRDGWLLTGDLAHFDDEGFLHIEGRLARFSKIGGEMVPHGTVEEAVRAVWGEGGATVPELAIVGIPDEQKGEALVLLTTVAPDQEFLRKGLAARGLPNLWVPKKSVVVEALPQLGSGKLDLQACRRLAEAGMAAAAEAA
jgi:acyl-[acyl-carrier-protein]-phospholipid O-acyltransferase/long-chain-fatty-acid--[acyl-carrier-protein] ligase